MAYWVASPSLPLRVYGRMGKVSVCLYCMMTDTTSLLVHGTCILVVGGGGGGGQSKVLMVRLPGF